MSILNRERKGIFMMYFTFQIWLTRQLVQKGYQIHFYNNEYKVIDKNKNMVMAKIEMTKNKVFPLAISYSNDMALKGESIEESLLWHLRYGHLHQRGLQLLQQKEMVKGLPRIEQKNHVCEGCIFWKMCHLPFPKTAWRAKTSLELVHVDIFSLTRTPLLVIKDISCCLLIIILR